VPQSNAVRLAAWRERQVEERRRSEEEEKLAEALEESRRVALELDDEQALRDRFGYAPSETRTKAERDATAERIMSKHYQWMRDRARDYETEKGR
jgi:hypothetical protein